MLSITVRLDEKRSTASQYENRTAGVVIEAQGLELHTPEQVLAKADELWALAQESVARQFMDGPASPSSESRSIPGGSIGQGPNGTVHAATNGHATDGHVVNGSGQSHGRPSQGSEPTPKQRTLLRKLAKDRNLGPESIREICHRLVGKDPRNLDRKDMSRLIEGLLAPQVA